MNKLQRVTLLHSAMEKCSMVEIVAAAILQADSRKDKCLRDQLCAVAAGSSQLGVEADAEKRCGFDHSKLRKYGSSFCNQCGADIRTA